MPYPTTSAAAPAYEGILYTVFQQLRQKSQPPETGKKQAGLVVAFTSANSGEGVTHTISALLAGIVQEGKSRSLLIESDRLRDLSISPSEISKLCRPISREPEASVCELVDQVSISGVLAGEHSWGASWEYRQEVLGELRNLFDYVLIDCPAIKQSSDLLALAPFVDGVILIVAAGNTRRDQVLYAEKQIEFAKGRLLGHILNKRTYAVPEWLYQRL